MEMINKVLAFEYVLCLRDKDDSKPHDIHYLDVCEKNVFIPQDWPPKLIVTGLVALITKAVREIEDVLPDDDLRKSTHKIIEDCVKIMEKMDGKLEDAVNE